MLGQIEYPSFIGNSTYIYNKVHYCSFLFVFKCGVGHGIHLMMNYLGWDVNRQEIL